MNYLTMAIFVLIGAMCIYVILDRICGCIEQCTIARAFGKYIEHGGDADIQKFTDGVHKSKHEK